AQVERVAEIDRLGPRRRDDTELLAARAVADRERQVGLAEQAAPREQDGALDQVREVADVAGPAIGARRLVRRLVEAADVAAGSLGGAGHAARGDRQDVL